MGRSLLSETAAWVPPSLPNNSQPIASSPRTFRHCENGETDTVAQFAQTYRICQQQQIQSAKRGGGRNGIMGRIAGTWRMSRLHSEEEQRRGMLSTIRQHSIKQLFRLPRT